MTAYYNECDPKAAAWLRELIAGGLIASGDVDESSIDDVRPSDLAGYRQCHFFAGIGVWSYALRSAGWPDDRPCWTGSCPCQPFSAAGKGAGFDDKRHLWPSWFWLISQCRPDTVFGEQVAAAVRGSWLDLVSSDLEGIDYSFGAAVVGAHSVGAPHIRQRLFFVADALGRRCEQRNAGQRDVSVPDSNVAVDFVGDSFGAGLEGFAGNGDNGNRSGRLGTGAARSASASSGAGFWRDCEWLPCRDGKMRPVEPGVAPLVVGASGRVGLLRGYGNAIVGPLAAEFIKAYLEITG